MIHTVRNPFMCREGQFGKGRKLVIGILADVLKGKEHIFRIGKNPKIYKGDTEMIKSNGNLWENKKGQSIYIIPVECFETIENEPS